MRLRPRRFQVANALDFLRIAPKARQSRQQHARQNGDDGDHDQRSMSVKAPIFVLQNVDSYDD